MNIRTELLAAAIAIVLGHRLLFARHTDQTEFSRQLTVILDIVAVLIGFEIITVEVLSFFEKAHLLKLHTMFGLHLNIAQTLTLAVGWGLYATSLAVLGRSRRLLIAGVALVCAAAVFAAFGGLSFRPVSAFELILNYRVLAFGVVIAAVIIQQRKLAAFADESEWARTLNSLFRVAISLIFFELITAEVWSLYSRSMALDSMHLDHFANLRQMVVSVAWVVYSIILMSYGIWRRSISLRFVSISIFALTLMKVVFVDLANIGSLYRIFSFLALGIILMITSYLYQRYKSIILTGESAEETEE